MRADYLAVVAIKAVVDTDGRRHDAHEPFDQARSACASPPRSWSCVMIAKSNGFPVRLRDQRGAFDSCHHGSSCRVVKGPF
jgi:hypothetical protein